MCIINVLAIPENACFDRMGPASVPWCWLGLKVYDLIAWSQALGKCVLVTLATLLRSGTTGSLHLEQISNYPAHNLTGFGPGIPVKEG